MNEQVAANPLGTERVGKLMIRYAIPSIISIVVNSLYNMVDQIFIGQGVGYLGNAATNIILPLTSILLALGMMIGDGTASYMSLNLGKGRNEDAAQGVGNAVTLTVGISVLLLVLFELFLEPLCHLFGATEGNLPYALEYGSIIVLGFPFAMIDGAFGSIIRADGRPKVSMVGLLIGCITNIILDPIFIFVCHWGVKGAAWATIIGQILNAAYFIVCMLRFKTIKVTRQHLVPKWTVIKKLLTLGTSSFISQVASVFVIAVMNNSLVKYGAMSKYWSFHLPGINDRVRLEYTVSYQNVTDQIFSVPTAGSTGYQYLMTNAGKMRTWSHEIGLNMAVLQHRDYDLNLGVNFTAVDNKVVELAEGVESIMLGGFVDPQVRAQAGNNMGGYFERFSVPNTTSIGGGLKMTF